MREALNDLKWQMELQYMQGNCTRIESWCVQMMLVSMFRNVLEDK